MQCPVCGGEAQDVTEIPIKRRGIKCPSCGEYDVSGTVYDMMLQKLDKDARTRALNSARCSATPPGKRPFITKYDL